MCALTCALYACSFQANEQIVCAGMCAINGWYVCTDVCTDMCTCLYADMCNAPITISCR